METMCTTSISAGSAAWGIALDTHASSSSRANHINISQCNLFCKFHFLLSIYTYLLICDSATPYAYTFKSEKIKKRRPNPRIGTGTAIHGSALPVRPTTTVAYVSARSTRKSGVSRRLNTHNKPRVRLRQQGRRTPLQQSQKGKFKNHHRWVFHFWGINMPPLN